MIKNYTSSVPAAKSVAHIEDQLIRHGATEILKICENGRLIGIAFCLMVSEVKTAFRLPANIENVEKYLLSFRSAPMPCASSIVICVRRPILMPRNIPGLAISSLLAVS